MNTAAMPAIEVNGLSKRYGTVTALAPLTLQVPRGSVFALVGHNGAGKTTLLKLLLNILQPSAGTASVLGQPSTRLNSESFTHIGYVSENQEMPDWMTVRGFLDYLQPFYPKWDEGTLIEELDLPPDRKLKHLSRGMRMKAALASVLAYKPSIILMDEPFSGLDPLVRSEMIQALLDRVAAADTDAPTIVISSHDLAEVETFATHVAILHGGKLLFAETLDDLLARFREVTVIFGAAGVPDPLPTLPASFILVESGTGSLRTIHTDAAAQQVEQQMRSLFPTAVEVLTEPMSLRTIFLALARHNGPAEWSHA